MQNEITELRNQVRTLKRIVYGFGCLFVAGLVVGATSLQTVPDVIQAKRFEVVNGEEKVVAAIYADANGGGLIIYNKDEIPVAAIGATADGGALGINNKDGKPVVLTGAIANGSGGVTTYNSKGKITSTTP